MGFSGNFSSKTCMIRSDSVYSCPSSSIAGNSPEGTCVHHHYHEALNKASCICNADSVPGILDLCPLFAFVDVSIDCSLNVWAQTLQVLQISQVLQQCNLVSSNVCYSASVLDVCHLERKT